MKRSIKNIFFKTISVSIIIIFGTLISFKNDMVKANIYKNIYNSNISFAKYKNLYNNYIGSIIPFDQFIKEESVIGEKIRYKELNTYDKGIKLTLEDNYAIPILKDGIVIFIGNKDNLNKTVIIEDENGVDTYYGNLDNVNVKLYDYVKKNNLLGSANNNTLYLLFEKDNTYLDYKEFLQ